MIFEVLILRLSWNLILYVNFTLHFWEHMTSYLIIYEWFDVGSPVDVNDGVCLFKHAHVVQTMVCVKKISYWQHSVSMFVGIISSKPSPDFTRPLRSPRGLKGLLHMLNAIVSPTRADLCFMPWFCFHFVLLRDLQNVSLGVFDECQILYIWTPQFTLVRPLALLFSNVFC